MQESIVRALAVRGQLHELEVELAENFHTLAQAYTSVTGFTALDVVPLLLVVWRPLRPVNGVFWAAWPGRCSWNRGAHASGV
jgi:hypothetical protein